LNSYNKSVEDKIFKIMGATCETCNSASEANTIVISTDGSNYLEPAEFYNDKTK